MWPRLNCRSQGPLLELRFLSGAYASERQFQQNTCRWPQSCLKKRAARESACKKPGAWKPEKFRADEKLQAPWTST